MSLLPLSDADADALVGTVDDEDPVELIEDDEAGAPPAPPDYWDSDAHDDEYTEDPLVVIEGTEDPEDAP